MLSVSFYGSGWKVNADGSFRIYAIWFYIFYMTFDVIASIQSSCVFDCVSVIEDLHVFSFAFFPFSHLHLTCSCCKGYDNIT